MCVNLWLRWGLQQNCSPCQEIFNSMWNTTSTQWNWSDSRHLMIRSQINNLTLDLSFGHNLCFKYPNGPCKTILNIYVSRIFQWYHELFNLMGFHTCNFSLKIWESIKTPTPKMGAHLGMWSVHSFPHTLSHSREHEMWFSGFTFGPHLRKSLLWSQAQS